MQAFVDIVFFGSAYALLAVGYVLTNRAAGGFNLAFTTGAALGAVAATWLLQTDHPLWQCVIGGIIAGGLLGIVIDKLVLLPSRIRPDGPLGPNQALIAGAAVSALLFAVIDPYGLQVSAKPYLRIAFRATSAVTVRLELGLTIACVLALAAVWLLHRFTRFGVVERALAVNASAARASGVGREWVIAQAAFLASSLGACAGIALAIGSGVDAAFSVGAVALCAVMLGGLTSPLGGLLGGFGVATAQVLLQSHVDVHALAAALTVCGLILVPRGITARMLQRRSERSA